MACLAMLAACASLEDRDEREDVRNVLRRDAIACGTDTACLQKREASRKRPANAPAAAAKPAP
jgi:hypothetical protein